MIKKKCVAIKRRARKVRAQIRELGVPRVCIHRTPRHIYAQIISACGSKIVAAASSLEKNVRDKMKETKGKLTTAQHVGNLVATRAIEKGIKKVAFDRSGFKYHGRVKALADGAREGGLDF